MHTIVDTYLGIKLEQQGQLPVLSPYYANNYYLVYGNTTDRTKKKTSDYKNALVVDFLIYMYNPDASVHLDNLLSESTICCRSQSMFT